jgi:hypothetical protein
MPDSSRDALARSAAERRSEANRRGWVTRKARQAAEGAERTLHDQLRQAIFDTRQAALPCDWLSDRFDTASFSSWVQPWIRTTFPVLVDMHPGLSNEYEEELMCFGSNGFVKVFTPWSQDVMPEMSLKELLHYLILTIPDGIATVDRLVEAANGLFPWYTGRTFEIRGGRHGVCDLREHILTHVDHNAQQGISNASSIRRIPRTEREFQDFVILLPPTMRQGRNKILHVWHSFRGGLGTVSSCKYSI